MGVELRPLGLACNIQCQYCYQNSQRDAGNVPRQYDLELTKQAVEREGGPFTLFGGEPLLLPEDDIEALWSWSFERYGRNSVQTNGVLISDRHMEMFQRYNVSVGISIDGPGELNDVRWVGALERTREATSRTERTIERLCEAGMPPVWSSPSTAEMRSATGSGVCSTGSVGLRGPGCGALGCTCSRWTILGLESATR